MARSRALTVCLPFGGRRCFFILHGPTGWQLDLGHGGGLHARDTGRQRPPDRRTDGRMTSGAWLSLALVVAGRRPGLQPSRPRSTREEEGRGRAKVRRQP